MLIHAMKPGKVHTRLRHQRRQTGNEIQRFEDHMGGAVPVRRLELVTDVTIRCQTQPLLGYRRAADVAAQPFELLAFIPDPLSRCVRPEQ